jgi:hypothetical protein
MNLFTSNSKLLKKLSRDNSILRIIFLCLITLGLYHILTVFQILAPSDGIHQQERNLIKIERFFYSDRPENKIVFVGSSLTDNLPTNLISANIVNLGMSGGSSQTGLEIIKIIKSKPNLVLVEITDTIDRGINNEFVSYFQDNISYLSRLYLPMLRAQYRPVSVFVSYLQKLNNNEQKNKQESLNIKKEESQNKSVPNTSELEKIIINRLIKENSRKLTPVEIDLITQQAQVIQHQIATLRENQIRVLLYRVPLETQLNDTTRQKEIHQILTSFFPQDTYKWLPELPTKEWKTYDGVHLKPESAQKYIEYLKDSIGDNS